jgi:hypothetical protein
MLKFDPIGLPHALPLIEIHESEGLNPRVMRKWKASVKEFEKRLQKSQIDLTPLRKAMEAGNIDEAVHLAYELGMEIGLALGQSTYSSIGGQAHLKRMAGARASRDNSSADRHADWQHRAEKIWAKAPGRTASRVAKLVCDELGREQKDAEDPERIPALKTIQNKIRRPT